jgi:hypothetical protein
MPDYLRYRVPGGTYFFTITLLERGGDLLVRHVDVLREAVGRVRTAHAEPARLLPARPCPAFDGG